MIGGGSKSPTEYRYGVYSFNFHQNFSKYFWEVEDDRNRPQGVLKEVIHFSDIAYALQRFDLLKKEPDLSDLSPKKFSESFEENWGNSGYALNLKALINVSKVSWTSKLSYEIVRSSFERKFDKANLISPKKPFQKHPRELWKKIAKISQCEGEEGKYIANSLYFFLYT